MSNPGDWRILFQPVFRERYEVLRVAARKIADGLSKDEARQHPAIKLFAAVNHLLSTVIPADPNAPQFQLSGNLSKFRRARGHGLPDRYRLFWVFSSSRRLIIMLYLNDAQTLRQEGSRNDPYIVFARLVERGDIGADFGANLKIIEAQQKKDQG